MDYDMRHIGDDNSYSFLEKTNSIGRPLSLNIKSLTAKMLFVGQGSQALEVVIFNSI